MDHARDLLVPFPRTPFQQQRQRVTIQLPSTASSSSSSSSSPSVYSIVFVLPANTSSTRVGEVKTALFQALAMAPAAANTTTTVPEGSSSNEPWCTLTLDLGKPPALHPAAQRRDVQPLLTRGPDCYVLLLTKLKGEAANTFLDDKDLVAVEQQEWRLVPAHELPPSRFLVRVTGTRRRMDAFGKEYVAYDITVKNGLLTWQLSKRYSDFAALHVKLKKHEQQQQQQQQLQLQGEEIAASPLLDLPPKLFQNVQGRQERLETYLQHVVDRPFSMENPHVLAFLGILSSMTAELSSLDTNTNDSTISTTKKKRQVLHISALKKTLQMGDIVLFQCAHNLAGLQRTVTGAEWDHVALVVDRPDGRGFDLLESTADGVTCWPLSSRISAYATEFTSCMGIRKLEGERTPAMQKQLQEFVERVKGKPYGFSLGTLFAKKYVTTAAAGASAVGGTEPSSTAATATGTSSSLPSSSSSALSSLEVLRGRWRQLGTAAASQLSNLSLKKDEEKGIEKQTAAAAATHTRRKSNVAEEEAGFFCSNLVAAALREMGVLKPEINHNYFWPGAFTAGGEVDEALWEGWRFGDVILLDVSALELGQALMMVEI